MLEPRVRRLPDLPRLLPAGLPRDRRPDDREDGRRDRHPVLPPRRRGAQARARWRSSSGSPTSSSSRTNPEDALEAIAEQPTAATAGWPRSRRPRTRGSGSPPAPATTTSTAPGSTTCGCPSTPCAATSRSSAAGEPIDRPLREIIGRARAGHRRVPRAARPRTTTEAFDRLVELARTVYPVRREPQLLRRALAPLDLLEPSARARRRPRRHGFLEDQEDSSTCTDTRSTRRSTTSRRAGPTGTPARGPSYWPPEVAERKRIMESSSAWSPPPALGQPPEDDHRAVHGHALGHHDRRRRAWLGRDGDERRRQLHGDRRVARASPRASRA